jgi:hypothetical protein
MRGATLSPRKFHIRMVRFIEKGLNILQLDISFDEGCLVHQTVETNNAVVLDNNIVSGRVKLEGTRPPIPYMAAPMGQSPHYQNAN